MYWKRLSHALLLGMGFSVLGVGCAAVDALVSSPAGRSADRNSTQRMAAIGRVFENQGRFAKAESMYRNALKADPSNSVARSRLEYVAGMKSQRKFAPTNQQTLEAFAVADALTTRPSLEAAATKASESQPKADMETALEDSAVVASLTPQTSSDKKSGESTMSEAATEPDSAESNGLEIGDNGAEAIVTETGVVATDAEHDSTGVVDTGWELAGMADDRPLSESWNEVADTFEDEVSGIATVGFEGEDSGLITAAAIQPDWKSATDAISLEKVLEWSDDVNANRTDLMLALSTGEDDGVKALAAAVLTETDRGDDDVNDALNDASRAGSDFLRVTALDALIQRDALDRETVSGLLTLLRTGNEEIKTQAATSLRHLVRTNWATDCVDGLTALLADQEPGVIAIAATTLGDFGVDAAGARGELESVLQDSDHADVTEAVELALQRIPADGNDGVGIGLPPVSNEIEVRAGGYLPFAE